jgi:hypothetical protein
LARMRCRVMISPQVLDCTGVNWPPRGRGIRAMNARRAPVFTGKPPAARTIACRGQPTELSATGLDVCSRLTSCSLVAERMIKRPHTWDARSTISRWAHILERSGLALTGASCGLFVAAHVGRANIDLIGSGAVVLAMMLYGAAGFYLGIDLPPAPPDHHMHLPLRHGLGSKADAVELLSAAGTFLAAVAAVVSVSSIVLDETAHAATALLISFGWGAGASMQIASGIIARTRDETSTTS